MIGGRRCDRRCRAGASGVAASARRGLRSPLAQLLLDIEQRIELLRIDARHQMLVGFTCVGSTSASLHTKRPIEAEELLRDTLGDLRQHRREQHASAA